MAAIASAELFNTQRLLFDLAQPITEPTPTEVPEDYYERGWIVIEGVSDEFEALSIQENLIRGIDPVKVPLYARFHGRIRLAKADEIPVCGDILTSSYQVLHFDMGHPLVETADPLFVSHVGVYSSPKRQQELDTMNNLRTANGMTLLPNPSAETRIVSLGDLTSLSAEEADTRLATYASDHGDGWHNYNTGRIACGARVLDAFSDSPELQDQTDKTVGQWFGNGFKVDGSTAFEREAAFYVKHGISLHEREQRVALKAGQLLFLDNTRVLHGRIGRRAAKEVFNFMFGIEAMESSDIKALRQSIGRLVVRK